MNKNGIIIGIIGGFGIGLLLGSEFAGRLITLFGSIIMIFYFLLIFIFYIKKRK